MIFCFVFAIFSNNEEENNADQVKTDEIVIIFLVLATAFSFIAGVCMMGVTDVYYSAATDTVIETVPNSSYQPLGWIGIGFGVFLFYLTGNKIFDVIGYQYEEETGQ